MQKENTRKTHLEGHYYISASREAVYSLLTNFENLPKNFPQVAKSAKIISMNGNDFDVEVKTKAFPGSRLFTVRMIGTLNPGFGFRSTNTSSLGVEEELVVLCDDSGGTRIDYINDVAINSPIFRIFAKFLIKRLALWYWEMAIIKKMKLILEKPKQ